MVNAVILKLRSQSAAIRARKAREVFTVYNSSTMSVWTTVYTASTMWGGLLLSG